MRRKCSTWWCFSVAMSALIVPAVHGRSAYAETLGDIQSWKQEDATVAFACGKSVVKLAFWADDVLRITLLPDGKPGRSGQQLVLPECYGPAPAVNVADGNSVTVTTKRMVVRVDKKPFRLHFFQTDGMTPITCNPEGATLDTELAAFFNLDASSKPEHLFGGGGQESAASCDLRGRSFVCADRPGNGCPAPFVMSTAGYGLLVNSDFGNHVRFDLHNQASLSFSVEKERHMDEVLDFFFLYGPGLEHVIDRLTTLTGKPPMFPKPVFGLSYHTRCGPDQSGAGGFARFREKGYPIDGCITFINRAWHQKSDDYVEKTSAEIHDLHGWVVGYLDSTDSYVGMLMDTDFPYRKWDYYREHLDARLFKHGIDSIYMDELEKRGTLFGLRALQSTYDTMLKAFPGRRAVVLTRSGYTGCQRYAYLWMGDTGPHARSARDVVRAQLGHGLSGIPFTTHDLGGYWGPGSKAGCIRGAQLNFLQPMAHLNCYRGKGEPWNWDSEAEKIFMKFDQLHYRLLPYWYTCAWQSHTTGMPTWRHMVFTDPAYFDQDTAMMVGDWFYFAPILDEGTSRPVFIPKGRWIDYFTGEVFNGPRQLASYETPIDRTPLFIKAGAIVPMGPQVHYVDEKPLAPLTLDLYPYGCDSSQYTVYEDDGLSQKYLKGDFATTAIDMTERGGLITVTLRARKGAFTPPKREVETVLHGIKARPSSVALDGRPLEFAHEPATGVLKVSFPDTGREQVLTVRR